MKRLIKRAGIIIFFVFIISLLFSYSVHNSKSDDNNISINDDENGSSAEETPPSVLPDEEKVHDEISVSDYINSTFSGESDGLVLTDAVFDEKTVLTLVKLSDTSFFPRQAKYRIDVPVGDGNYVTEEYFTVWPRMGYITMSDGVSKKFLTNKGNVIPVADISKLAFAGVRNIFGEPLFIDYSTGRYCILSEDGTLTESWYDSDKDSRGLNFDYPSYFGVTDDWQYTVTKTNRGYGYNIEAELRDVQNVQPIYKKAFNYSEGFGCAYDVQNRLYFFNNQGRLRIAGLAVIMYGCGDRTDERSLGYYYFDEGLTRVTKKQFSRGKLVSEYETFIDRKGNEFKTPEDYSVYSYSNGRILLQKDGRSGYMTSRGKWITEPVYTYARPFFEGLAVVGEKDGKKGVIDRNGNYVIEPVFDEITDCSGGVIALFDKDTGWYILNKMTKSGEIIEQTPSENTVPAL